MRWIVLTATISFCAVASAQQKESVSIVESKQKSVGPALDESARQNILEKIRAAQRLLKGTLLYRFDNGAVVRNEKGEDVYLYGPIPDVAENSPIEILVVRSGFAAFAGPTEVRPVQRYFTDINEVLELIIATSSSDELKQFALPPVT